MQNLLSSLEPGDSETGLVRAVLEPMRRLGPEDAEKCLETAIASFRKQNGS